MPHMMQVRPSRRVQDLKTPHTYCRPRENDNNIELRHKMQLWRVHQVAEAQVCSWVTHPMPLGECYTCIPVAPDSAATTVWKTCQLYRHQESPLHKPMVPSLCNIMQLHLVLLPPQTARL